MEADVLFIPKARKVVLARPAPPPELDLRSMNFLPSPELAAWAKATFIEVNGPLYNERYEHLEPADIGFLWANGICEAAGGRHRVQGMCEIVGQGERRTWGAQRHALQVRDFFGFLPDFIITLDAVLCSEMTDLQFCSLVEHELHHAGQAEDQHGLPRFTKQGRPVYALNPHDVEEFVGVVERYGGRGKVHLDAMLRAGARPPSIGEADLWMACGTCKQRRAA